jgi:hypothetical protein
LALVGHLPLAPRPAPGRARAAAVTAVGSTAVRASGASRWPPSVVLAIGAAAARPFGAALQRSFPTAVAAAGAAIAAAVTAAATAAAANATVPLLCPIAARHSTVLASMPAPPVEGWPSCSLGGLAVRRPWRPRRRALQLLARHGLKGYSLVGLLLFCS